MMKYVYLTLNWVFGVFFLLIGLVSLIDSPLGGLCLMVISLLLLPPSRKFIYSKTNKTLSVKIRAVAILSLFIVFSVIINKAQDEERQMIATKQAQEQAEKIAKVRQENIDYFHQNKDSILTQANSALTKKDYQAVVSQTAKYLVAGNEELIAINKTAKTAIEKAQKAKKTEAILTQLKTIPSSEFEKNKTLYQQLSTMHPNNKKYKEKIAHYAAKIEELKQKKVAERARKLAEEARKKKIERQFSSWDGSHTHLERFIKTAMNDPDSYEHDKTVYWDNGDHLVILTTYRGKNAFGGVVRNFVKVKASLDGDILQILDQT